MLHYASLDSVNLSPRHDGVHLAVTPTARQIIVSETQTAKVVRVVGQVEVAKDVPAGDGPRLSWVSLKYHPLLGEQPAVGCELGACLRGVLWRDQVGMSAIGALASEGEHLGAKRRQYSGRSLPWLDGSVGLRSLVH